MMMRVLVSVGGTWFLDLLRRKRAQLSFGRLNKRTNDDANKKDCDGDNGLFHGLYSPLYVTMMQ